MYWKIKKFELKLTLGFITVLNVGGKYIVFTTEQL